jgi:outer membrane protein OmpA-like peptidoglycan-associated protein
MTRKFGIVILIALLSRVISGQPEPYKVTKAYFSSDKFDEFSPVFFNNGIVYCSNRNYGLSSRSTDDEKGLFNIVYIDSTGKKDPLSAKLLSKNLTTILNDGPATFSKNRDTIYFSRNQNIDSKAGNISGPRNKLGIFSSVLVDGEWTKVRELRINNEWYNVTTPSLSPDSKRIYFASDKPGGFGGSDLYYSNWNGDRWEDPVNLGPVINTKGNESYPYVNTVGEIFFSSDGHPGLGGKDIFFSLYLDSAWQKPIHLDPPINSKYDDFGIVADNMMNQGYFSSNRGKSVDIYQFKTIIPQVFYDIKQKENQYCYLLSDTGSIVIDTAYLKYQWIFGDGTQATGSKVRHCFPGPGKYTIKLDIFDKRTNKLFFSKLEYEFELRDFKQPYINSQDTVVKGETVSFDGQKSNFPGYKVVGYYWNFRDGTRAAGERVTHAFKLKGEFMVNMEVVMKSNSTNEIRKTGVSKKLLVYDSITEKASKKVKTGSTPLPVLGNSENAKITPLFSAENEFKKDVVYNVELISSKTKIGVNNSVFRNVPKKYTLSEKFIPEDSTYSYIVDQQMTLMATYPAYSELYNMGFKNIKIKTFVLTDPVEKELYGLIKVNGALADTYFDANDKLTSNAYIMLDQIIKLMNKYPAIKLEVAVHSDNTLPAPTSQILSQSRAQSLVSYMVNRGISPKRLKSTGFGSSKPIASNNLDKDRKLNRRIDFIIFN